MSSEFNDNVAELAGAGIEINAVTEWKLDAIHFTGGPILFLS
jgi:hypothetical protein